jgi:hypothetical protein
MEAGGVGLAVAEAVIEKDESTVSSSLATFCFSVKMQGVEGNY